VRHPPAPNAATPAPSVPRKARRDTRGLPAPLSRISSSGVSDVSAASQ
jgi:hypothetical protein